jgi:hypothetical protein
MREMALRGRIEKVMAVPLTKRPGPAGSKQLSLLSP